MSLRGGQRLSGRRPARSSTRDPDLTSLINIVFLILIFFIVAGTLRPFSARDIDLAKVAKGAALSAVPSSLIVDKVGRIKISGREVALEELSAALAGALRPKAGKPFTIVADGRAPGSLVLEVSRQLHAAGVKEVAVMVERGRK